MLTMFTEQQVNVVAQIQAAMQSKEQETAQIRAHSLKGVAAMLEVFDYNQLHQQIEAFDFSSAGKTLEDIIIEYTELGL